VVADGAGRKEKLIAQIRKHISENLDLRKDFSDEEIKDIITNVVLKGQGIITSAWGEEGNCRCDF